MLHQFPTLNSGLTLKDFANKQPQTNYPSHNLRIYETGDGSISLLNTDLREGFHDSNGAKNEAIEKFIKPSEINLFKKQKEISILDLCVGMGYNSACLMDEILKTRLSLNWWGIEKDKRPLEIALSSSRFRSTWKNKTLSFLECINQKSHWKSNLGKGKMLWGDARLEITKIPQEIKYDLIFHDAFSPQKSPELWSEEFLQDLSKKLSNGGKLITYSRAAAIRASLRRSGLILQSLLTTKSSENDWSNGTVAIKSANPQNKATNTHLWSSLSQMEEDHLKTVAAVPYRDPTGKSSSLEIIARRNSEQKKSNLSSTNSWKKRWVRTKY